jgi:ankyrin repeat protein
MCKKKKIALPATTFLLGLLVAQQTCSMQKRYSLDSWKQPSTQKTEKTELKNYRSLPKNFQIPTLDQVNQWHDALLNAVEHDDIPEVTKILGNAEETMMPIIEASDTHFNTPIHIACERGNYPMVELLSTKGAKIDKTNLWDETPLHIVCRQGNPKTAYLLMKNRVKLGEKSRSNGTPVETACKYHQLIILQLLLDQRVSIPPTVAQQYGEFIHKISPETKILASFYSDRSRFERDTRTIMQDQHYPETSNSKSNRQIATVKNLARKYRCHDAFEYLRLFLLGKRLCNHAINEKLVDVQFGFFGEYA